MTITLRKALMLALLTLPLIMVAVLGAMSYNNAIEIVDELGERVVQQTTERIRSEVSTLLNEASILSYANQGFIQRTKPNNTQLTSDFMRQILQHDEFSYLSYSRVDGSYIHIQRLPDNHFEALHIDKGKQQKSEWTGERWQVKGPRVNSTQNPRSRPYYKAALAAGKQTWTDVYLLGTIPGQQNPGLTCATPVYDQSGKLLGVLTVDFTLAALNDYLRHLKVFDSGIAFVLDDDQILAHPNANHMMKTEQVNGKNMTTLRMDKDVQDDVLLGFLKAAKQGAVSTLAEFEWTTNDIDYLGFTEPLKGIQGFDWSVGIMVPRLELTQNVEQHIRTIGWVAIASLITLILVGIILARSIAKPLRQLTEEVGNIGQFEVQAAPLPETWLWEVERLSKATEEMKTGLRSFGKFVPVELVKSVLSSGVEAKLGGEERELTVFFSDIKNFTGISEQLSPTELVELLGEYLGAMTDEIISTKGTVDKYIGDAVMAFWGAPNADLKHASNACDAALRNIQRLSELQEKWQSNKQPIIDCRIGINTGPLVVGNIGSHDRLNYTVIGDSVNLAARLEGLNKYYGTRILISDFTAQQVSNEFITRPLEYVAVKGKSEGVLVHELLARNSDASDQQKRLSELSFNAIKYYTQRDFKRAVKLFEEILTLREGDLASLRSIESCHEFIENPPQDDWQWVRVMSVK